jgi:hypothetical protein
MGFQPMSPYYGADTGWKPVPRKGLAAPFPFTMGGFLLLFGHLSFTFRHDGF